MSLISKIQNLIDPSKYYVIGVHDGDTISVIGGAFNLKKQSIRMVGINSNELKNNLKKVTSDEPFSVEARDYLKSLILNRYITFEIDQTQFAKDKMGVKQYGQDMYGRILAYITDEYGNDINLRMLATGFAKVYNYNPKIPFVKIREYQIAENLAKSSAIGIWSNPKF
jgi:endonuclease YncB( thermonuclease family)